MHESAEMYLETIYKLSLEHAHVRSIDVAVSMGYSRPSVSRAVGLLKNSGHLEVDPDGFLSLTESGLEIARSIYDRHKVLEKALVALGVDEETASEDACKIEHVISPKTLAAIKAHMQKYEKSNM